MGSWNKPRRRFLRSWKLPALLLGAAAVLWGAAAALTLVDDAQSGEGQRLLEDSLRTAAVNSYVSEGAYPATLAELTERYGICIDTERYLVSYDIFADNIMPEISVTALSTEGGAAG